MKACKVVDEVEMSGLADAVRSISAGEITDDSELADAWAQAELALSNLDRVLDRVNCNADQDESEEATAINE